MIKTERPSVSPVFAGAVVIASDGRILCQLRDNKPDIIYPGYWSCTPGGHVEEGELPQDAIVRELFEEFEIKIAGLKQLATLVEMEGDISGTYHAFSANLASPMDQIVCNEGIKAEFFSIDDAIKLPQHPVSKKILFEYIKQNQS